MEVNDGVSWRSLAANSTSIALTVDAQQALDWAISKMQQEARLEEISKTHPAVKDLKEKLDIMLTLVGQESQL